ncbi:MAG: putative 10 drug/metabolite exporter, family, superfamily [Candidatus Angelobacter sp.]|jgi:drug/metabolite transporter (DMT)-like permease|nr:putative 10 drug/metabolite exporter, family, superfamily [Candidatus Angelobacter sp.]
MIAFIWGSTFVLVKEALNDASPLVLNSARMVVAAVLLAIFYRKKIAVLTKPALIAGVVVGIFLYLGYAFQTSGLKLTTPSKSAFLTGTSSVLVPLVLVAIWHVRIHLWRVAGIVLALIGLFLMTVPGGGTGLADFAKVNLGDLLTVGCAICFTFHVIFVGRASQRFPFEQVAVLQVGTAAILMTVSTPLLEHPYFRPTATVIAAVLITGILCTAVAFSVQSWAQQFTPATHTALIFTTEPVFAWLTSFIYLHERLGLRAGAGALLILGGVLVSELLGHVEKPDDEPGVAESPASSAG